MTEDCPLQNKFDNNNFEIDTEQAKKYAFRVRLREVFTDGLFTLVKWNFLFVICSLPIVTIAPAVAALFNCTNLQVTDDRPQFSASKWFFASFKAACRKMFVPGIFFTLANIVLVFGFAFYLKLAGTSAVYIPLASFSLLALVIIWAVAIHAFPMIFRETDFDAGIVSTNDKNLTEIAKEAAALALTKTKATAIVLILGFAVVAAQFLFFPASTPVVLTLGFALPAQAAALAHTEPEIIDM